MYFVFVEMHLWRSGLFGYKELKDIHGCVNTFEIFKQGSLGRNKCLTCTYQGLRAKKV